MTRFLSSLSAVAIGLSILQPAFAAATSTEDVLAELASFDAATICKDREGRNLGKCIGDVVKRIGMLRDDFGQALKAERASWYEANGNLGVSAEYTIKLQQYLDGVKEKRAKFIELQRSLEKTFFAARKQILDSAESDTKTYSREVKSGDLETAIMKCAKQADSKGLRICLRQQLRLMDPSTRMLNVTPAGTRSTK